MNYCPECKKPLTSYTGNFRWCELCGYTSKVKAHSAVSEFEGYRLRDVVKSLTLENRAFKSHAIETLAKEIFKQTYNEDMWGAKTCRQAREKTIVQATHLLGGKVT